MKFLVRLRGKRQDSGNKFRSWPEVHVVSRHQKIPALLSQAVVVLTVPSLGPAALCHKLCISLM